MINIAILHDLHVNISNHDTYSHIKNVHAPNYSLLQTHHLSHYQTILQYHFLVFDQLHLLTYQLTLLLLLIDLFMNQLVMMMNYDLYYGRMNSLRRHINQIYYVLNVILIKVTRISNLSGYHIDLLEWLLVNGAYKIYKMVL